MRKKNREWYPKEDFYINCMQECMYVVGLVCCMFVYISTVLYMSFDRFLLAVESRDLSQANKSLIRVYFFHNGLIFGSYLGIIYIKDSPKSH